MLMLTPAKGGDMSPEEFVTQSRLTFKDKNLVYDIREEFLKIMREGTSKEAMYMVQNFDLLYQIHDFIYEIESP